MRCAEFMPTLIMGRKNSAEYRGRTPRRYRGRTGRGMAQARTGFFARLFRRRRPGDDFEPSLAHALAATVRKGLQRVTGKELQARCEPLPVEALLEELAQRPSGWMTRFFQDSSSSWLIFLMPDDWLAAIAALAPEENGKKVPYMVA